MKITENDVIFKHKDQVKFSEVDKDKRLGIRGILNYFQDVSEMQSSSLGTGYLTLDKTKCIWIINSWQIQIKKRPILGDTIYSATAPHKIKGIEGDRNFFILGEDGEVYVNANSIWSFYDREKQTLMRVPKSQYDAFKLAEPYPMDYEPRRINIRNTDLKDYIKDDEFKVRYSMTDMNDHMNNSQYAIISSDYIRRDYKYDQLRVEYARMALLDDKVIVRHYEDEERYIIILCNENDDIFSISEFKDLGLAKES
ncbi:MAG: hypothetical protein K6B28_08220 [Lachnospiraceae bacterium]|nr:hypothetical protein [Lachnospiraceae bacterium]